ncbi:MAG: S1 RNA-binding domain-containing protein [Planctomycetota bacterium]|nr:MAG: S1 RNA-binding domain-containing protein [Planctomycetota bacterium]
MPNGETRGAFVNVDPNELNDEAIRQELDRQIADISNEELDRMVGDGPARHPTNEHGWIRGTIIEQRGDDVFVDIGGKSEAFLPAGEFDAHDPPKPGQTLSFVMQGLDRESGLMRLSLREARLQADLESLKPGDVIEARVTGVNIGGLELHSGSLRAFMPKSQVELERVEDFTPYIGRRLECEVSEIDRKGKNIVVSRRKLLERARDAEREELKQSLAEGQVRRGVVRRLTDFGAFIDIGGVEGLLRVADMAWGRVGHPSNVLKPGEEVEVKILKIDREKDRISLGLKQLQPDPWDVVEGNYRPGDTVEGRVTRLMDFGAFVELSEGVEGLIPISELSWTQRVRHPRDVLKEGDGVRVSVLNVDVPKRRISLSLKALGEDPWKSVAERYAPDSIVSGAVTRLTDFGAFVQLEEGVEGLVHISEMSEKRIRSAADVVKVGDVVRVLIKSVDPEQRRISLSMKLAENPPKSEDGHAADKPAAASTRRRKPRKLKGGLDA